MEDIPVFEKDIKHTFDDLILSETIQTACQEVMEEQKSRGVLRAHNIEPRHRLLLIGSPGNGKTLLAGPG